MSITHHKADQAARIESNKKLVFKVFEQLFKDLSTHNNHCFLERDVIFTDHLIRNDLKGIGDIVENSQSIELTEVFKRPAFKKLQLLNCIRYSEMSLATRRSLPDIFIEALGFSERLPLANYLGDPDGQALLSMFDNLSISLCSGLSIRPSTKRHWIKRILLY